MASRTRPQAAAKRSPMGKSRAKPMRQAGNLAIRSGSAANLGPMTPDMGTPSSRAYQEEDEGSRNPLDVFAELDSLLAGMPATELEIMEGQQKAIAGELGSALASMNRRMEKAALLEKQAEEEKNRPPSPREPQIPATELFAELDNIGCAIAPASDGCSGEASEEPLSSCIGDLQSLLQKVKIKNQQIEEGIESIEMTDEEVARAEREAAIAAVKNDPGPALIAHASKPELFPDIDNHLSLFAGSRKAKQTRQEIKEFQGHVEHGMHLVIHKQEAGAREATNLLFGKGGSNEDHHDWMRSTLRSLHRDKRPVQQRPLSVGEWSNPIPGW
eukprot:TRINITY_DN109760_c0_g1_i1.p1 TRINITY_DN109760_c0_g1~~TRINITY_DN109760_c0_g1_i1.p1  ORF type:complete len:329 (+),score=69.52 TRINITY_DN109760_c0_g1_i1:64-1050(+)